MRQPGQRSLPALLAAGLIALALALGATYATGPGGALWQSDGPPKSTVSTVPLVAEETARTRAFMASRDRLAERHASVTDGTSMGRILEIACHPMILVALLWPLLQRRRSPELSRP